MANRPTVYDVAERAGVSIATVSFAFRQPERVRPHTRQAVYDAAREIGYVPSANARGLARGDTGVLGLYSFDLALEAPQGVEPRGVPDDDEDALEADLRAFPLYVDEVQRGFELECWRHTKSVLISGGDLQDQNRLNDLAGRVDGLAVFPGPISEGDLAHVARHLPTVAFSRAPGVHPVLHLNVENRQGMNQLVEHLYLRHGCRRMEFIGPLENFDYIERFEAFSHTLELLGLPAPGEPLDVSGWSDADRFTALRTRLSADDLRDDSGVPLALVCASDQLALAVLDIAAEMRLTVPDELIVTGFDGITAGIVSQPSLTTVRQPMEAMGRFAARALISRPQARWSEPDVRTFQVAPVFRSSCGCGEGLQP